MFVFVEDSLKIISVHRTTVYLIQKLYWFSVVEAATFFIFQLLSNWTGSLREYIILLYLPFFNVYIFYGIYYKFDFIQLFLGIVSILCGNMIARFAKRYNTDKYH